MSPMPEGFNDYVRSPKDNPRQIISWETYLAYRPLLKEDWAGPIYPLSYRERAALADRLSVAPNRLSGLVIPSGESPLDSWLGQIVKDLESFRDLRGQGTDVATRLASFGVERVWMEDGCRIDEIEINCRSDWQVLLNSLAGFVCREEKDLFGISANIMPNGYVNGVDLAVLPFVPGRLFSGLREYYRGGQLLTACCCLEGQEGCLGGVIVSRHLQTVYEAMPIRDQIPEIGKVFALLLKPVGTKSVREVFTARNYSGCRATLTPKQHDVLTGKNR